MTVACFLVLLTGCSAEETQENLENGMIMGGINRVDWFNVNHGESKYGKANAYSNDQDYLLDNYDITEVEDSNLSELPAYDFSGPKPEFGSGQSASDDSLIASTSSLLEAENEASTSITMNGQTVCLVPLYSGVATTKYLARDDGSYQELLESNGKTKASVEEYVALAGSHTATQNSKFKHKLGLAAFQGTKATVGSNTYVQWQQAWNACYAVGQQLSKDGCKVSYGFSATGEAKSTDEPKKFFGDSSLRTMQDIGTAIGGIKPDYVIFIGFNEGAFGKASTTAKSKNTLMTYYDYGKTKNKKFCKSVKKNWTGVSDLAAALPVEKTFDVYKYSLSESSEMGLQKMQTAMYALKIGGYTGKSVGIMLGGFNENVAAGGEYCYAKPSVLYSAIATVIEKSL